MSVIVGLNTSAISRLKAVKEEKSLKVTLHCSAVYNEKFEEQF